MEHRVRERNRERKFRSWVVVKREREPTKGIRMFILHYEES